MPCEDNNDQLRGVLQSSVQALILMGVDNLNWFTPDMLAGITCSNLSEKKIFKELSKYIDFPADNVPTYCVTSVYSLYNFNFTDPKLHKQGFLNFEEFPCRKTCGFCRGMFLFSN